MNRRVPTLLTILLTIFLLVAPAAAQDAPPPTPASPSWLELPGPLPDGWTAAEAAGATFQARAGGAVLHVERGSAGELTLGTAGTGLRVERDEPFWAPFAGAWVEGKIFWGQADGGPAVGVVLAREGVTARVVGSATRRATAVGEALAYLERVRLRGVSGASALAPLDLSGRPEARINPVGLFIPMPDGWRPKLDLKKRIFRLTKRPLTMIFGKPGTSDHRDMRTLATMREAHGDGVVQPAFAKAAGHFRAYQLLRMEGGAVAHVTEIHLIRFKKLGDWNYNVVRVETSEPARGLAPARSVLSRLKIIP